MKNKKDLHKGLCLNAGDFWFLAFFFLALMLPAGPPRGEAAGNAYAGDLSGGLDATELLEPHLEGDCKDLNFVKQAVKEGGVAEPVDVKLLGKIEPASADVGLSFDEKLFIVNLLFEATGQTEEAKRRILQDRITSLGQDTDGVSKIELRKVLEQIRLVEFRTAERPADSVTATEKATADKPDEAKSAQQGLETQVSEKLEPQIEQSRAEVLSEQILQIFNDVSGDLSRLENPVELAEILYLGGRLKEAGIVYREALNRIDSEGADAFGEKAWILFQLGNCLRDEDPAEARKFYREMISQCPECPWVDLAKAEDELLGWFEKEKPKALLEEGTGAQRVE